VVPLAACSGGDDVQAFCDQGEETFAEVDATGALGDDPEAFAQAVTDLHDGFASMDPPEEISAEWGQFTDLFGGLDESLQGIDVTDQEAFLGALTDFSETAGSDDLTEASDTISTFITENCES
jgi:hypothetical protein